MKSKVEVYTEKGYIYTRVVLYPDELKEMDEHYRELGYRWLEATTVEESGYFGVEEIPLPLLLQLLLAEKFRYPEISENEDTVWATDQNSLCLDPVGTIVATLKFGKFMAESFKVPLVVKIEETIKFADEES